MVTGEANSVIQKRLKPKRICRSHHQVSARYKADDYIKTEEVVDKSATFDVFGEQPTTKDQQSDACEQHCIVVHTEKVAKKILVFVVDWLENKL